MDDLSQLASCSSKNPAVWRLEAFFGDKSGIIAAAASRDVHIRKNIAWGVTGSGHYLSESIAAMHQLAGKAKICTYVSSAGEEVLAMYGLFGELSKVSGGGYLEEIFLEKEEGSSSPKAGRLMRGIFDLLIIAPATANTVAKIAYGIADSLVTNTAALSNKAGVPIYILPADIKDSAVTRTPYTIDRNLCQRCEDCRPEEECPNGAIHYQIDLIKCSGCGLCLELCNFKAIRSEAFKVATRELDKRNIAILRGLPGFTVLESPQDIKKLV